jgi:nucleotide-binding universal stress UspA family protein
MNAETLEMTTAATVTAQPARRADPWVLHGPILVATDGTETGDAAMRVAEGLAADHRLTLHAISVLEPLANFFVPVDGLMTTLPPPIDDKARSELRLRALRERLATVARTPDGWNVDVRVGPIASTVVDVATDIDASLIVVGLGRQRPIDRLMGDEIAAQVVRRATMPVLAVPSNARVPLRRALVGVDFSRASIRAARAAVSLTTPPGYVWLAHVKQHMEAFGEAFEGTSIIYTQGVLAAFKKIEERLEKVELLEVRPVELEGKVADEILSFAASQRADLIVTGAHGHTLVERLLIGSVTTKLLRTAQTSLLVIPPYRETEG